MSILGKPTSQISKDMQITDDEAKVLLEQINAKKWWQGSVILEKDLSLGKIGNNQVEYWVISSQACNLYNYDFKSVNVFEIIAARKIETLDPNYKKGSNPRILHVKAESLDDTLLLELNIQNRRWVSRSILGSLPAPEFHITDSKQTGDPDWKKNQWLDNFAGWLGRSYTRVALPDSFNEAMDKSKIKEILGKLLNTYDDHLYGIYFLIDYDGSSDWTGRLGEMPPPYLLTIILVGYEDADPEVIKKELIKKIFKDVISDPNRRTEKIHRIDLANRNNIRLTEESIEARSVSDITLLELKSLIRYSLVDHLSDSSMAVSQE
jgi:hypothetical protein